MTIEQAKNILRNSKPTGSNAYTLMLNEAIDLAISALEKESCEDRGNSMIVAAAIKFYIENSKNEVVLCGVRHGDIYKQLQGLGFKPKEGYKEIEQGFVTDKGEFLNREQARLHAIESGQIKDIRKKELFSEDLW